MRNNGKNIAVAVGAGIFLLAAFAIDLVPSSQTMSQKIVKRGVVQTNHLLPAPYFTLGQSTNTQIEIAALPQSVKSAVLEKYVAYSIHEAYKDAENLYRLVLKNGDTRLVTFYNEEGEYLRHELVKTVKMVALK